MEMIAIILGWLRKITWYGSNSCNNVVHAIYVTDVTGNCSGRRNRCPIYPLSVLVGWKKEKKKLLFLCHGNSHPLITGIEHIVFLDWKCYSEISVLREFSTMEEHQILFVQIKIQLLYDCFSMHRRTENEFFPRKRFHFARQFGKTEYRNVTRSPNSTENVVPFFRNTINAVRRFESISLFSTNRRENRDSRYIIEKNKWIALRKGKSCSWLYII